ncbi:MAG: znuA [Rickettsiaceae bacterium]|jgi:zinc transport system substrate-binding protein|nr:znuA [Rickettsiaceae bacterium]
MNKFLKILFFCLIFIKQSLADQALSKPPKIASSINPVYQIAKFISGREQDNSLLVHPYFPLYEYNFRASGAFGSLSNTDVVFYISDNLETNLLSNLSILQKQPKTVQLIKAKGIKLLSISSRFGGGSDDPYIWMNPQNAIAMASEIANVLSALYPPNSEMYKKNLEQFKADIKVMDQKNIINLAKVKPKSFILDQNVTSYFEKYYNLPAAAVIRYKPDEVTTQSDIAIINGLIRKEGVTCVMSGLREKSVMASFLAQSNRINFLLTDVMGSGSSSSSKENGYVKMMSDFVRDLASCAS